MENIPDFEKLNKEQLISTLNKIISYFDFSKNDVPFSEGYKPLVDPVVNQSDKIEWWKNEVTIKHNYKGNLLSRFRRSSSLYV